MAKPKKPQTIQGFFCDDLFLAIPREQIARAEFLTRKKRTLPNGYDEAIAKFETELHALTDGAALTPELWLGKGKLKAQANVKAAATVLMTFGISRYPESPEEEARARALAAPVAPEEEMAP